MVTLCDLVIGFKNRMLEEMSGCLRLENSRHGVTPQYRTAMNMAHLNFLNGEFKQANVLFNKYLKQDEYYALTMYQRAVNLALKQYYGKDYYE